MLQLKQKPREKPTNRIPAKRQNSIFNTLPTLDDVLGPPEEVEIREMDIFSSSEKGEEIVDVVCHKIAVARGDVIKVDSDEEDNPPCVTRVQAMTLCKQLAGVVLEYGEAPSCRSSCVVVVHTYGTGV
ncbi:hypothetical protein J3R83DRAFT_12039 [Lanmaoa asiatica]|nr:hypothetical protein J3R83DRAFT_12039 [Lanmaoa asiatica]